MINLFQATISSQPFASPLLASPEALFYGFLKVIFVVGALLYLIFAVLIIRQVGLMSRTIVTGPSALLKTLVLAHFFVAGVVFLFFTFIL